MPLCHSLYLRSGRKCTQAFRAQGLSCLHYGTSSLLAPASPAILSLDPMQSSHGGVQESISNKNCLDIASDNVEDWTSPKYAHLPFRPDFSLFEPLEQIDHVVLEKENILDDSILNHNTNVALCERLVDLIKTDLIAADELRLHISNHRIELPADQNIIQHCFGLLMRSKDVHGYLEWINIIPDSELQRMISKERDSIFDQHLKQILCLIPSSFATIRRFFETLVLKGCLTNRLIRTTVSHLVRTQPPQSVLEFHYDAVRKICDLSTNSSNPDVFLGLCTKLYNHTILQLANQRHLSEAIELVNESWNPVPDSPPFRKKISPSTYRVLADQLLLLVADEQGSGRTDWSHHLERVLSSWNLSNPIGLESWLTSSDSVSQLPSGSRLTHKVSRSYPQYLDQTATLLSDGTHRIQDLADTTHRLVLYLKTVLSRGNHVKFVKSSHIANVIQKMLSLGGSFEEASRRCGYCGLHEDEEQYLKSLVFDDDQLRLFLNKVHTTGESLEFENQLLLPISVKFQSDVILLWAHSWMIYYQRNKQYARVIDIFLQYFIPLGVDREILNPSRSEAASSSIDIDIQTSSVPLIHPTTGVLTVLYDSILHTRPTKSASSILRSFLRQIPPSSTSNSYRTAGTVLENAGLSSTQIGSSIRSNRLQPNSASFQPFIRAFLRVGDVEKALNLLIEMQQYICVSSNELNPEEGVWIDLLEWCASQSAGPMTGCTSRGDRNWGLNRKRKRLGWSGEMKERLVYSVLERFVQQDQRINRPIPDMYQPSSSINPSNLIPKLYSQHSHFIDFYLDQLHWHTLHKKDLGSSSYLGLKLLKRIQAGFQVCGNRRGTKILDRLLCWRKGMEMK